MPVGLTRDAGWQIGVSRTVHHPVADVWRVLVGPAGLAVWLGAGAILPTEPGARYATASGVTGELRSYRPHDRVRLTWRPADWEHDTTLQVAVEDRGGSTVVRFHQERLASAAERARQREHWREVVAELVRTIDSRVAGA